MGHTYTASLRFYGLPHIVQGLSEELGLPGHVLPYRGGRHAPATPAPMLTWDYSIQPSAPNLNWESLQEPLEALLNVILPVRDRILLIAQTLERIWWCGHFQSSFDGGPQLTANLLERLSSFKLPLFLDCYHSDD